MLIKILLVLLLLFILFNLFRAGLVMLKGEPNQHLSKLLGRRVLYSVVAVIIILLAIATGLISPNASPY